MTSPAGSEYEAWMDAYQVVYADADTLRTLPCPHCGQPRLDLVYVMYKEDAEDGSMVFWCGNCLFGLPPTRAPIPPGARRALSGTENVPNFSLVFDDSEPIE